MHSKNNEPPFSACLPGLETTQTTLTTKGTLQECYQKLLGKAEPRGVKRRNLMHGIGYQSAGWVGKLSKGWVCWCVPLILALWKQMGQNLLWVQGQHGLCGEFQANQGCRGRSCLLKHAKQEVAVKDRQRWMGTIRKSLLLSGSEAQGEMVLRDLKSRGLNNMARAETWTVVTSRHFG